jgi:hypothetical protein
MDARAQNQAAWQYAARIRELDELCNAAQLRGSADYSAWGALCIVEKARLSELADRLPDYDFPLDSWTAGAATCQHIERYLALRQRMEGAL